MAEIKPMNMNDVKPINLNDVRPRDDFLNFNESRRNYKSSQEYHNKQSANSTWYLEYYRKEIELRISSFINDDNKESVAELPFTISIQGVDVSDIIQILTSKGYTCEISNDNLIIS